MTYEEFLQKFEEYKENYALKNNTPAWFAQNLKTLLSKNITIEDWNRIQIYLKNNTSDTNTIHEFLDSVVSSIKQLSQWEEATLQFPFDTTQLVPLETETPEHLEYIESVKTWISENYDKLLKAHILSDSLGKEYVRNSTQKGDSLIHFSRLYNVVEYSPTSAEVVFGIVDNSITLGFRRDALTSYDEFRTNLNYVWDAIEGKADISKYTLCGGFIPLYIPKFDSEEDLKNTIIDTTIFKNMFGVDLGFNGGLRQAPVALKLENNQSLYKVIIYTFAQSGYIISDWHWHSDAVEDALVIINNILYYTKYTQIENYMQEDENKFLLDNWVIRVEVPEITTLEQKIDSLQTQVNTLKSIVDELDADVNALIPLTSEEVTTLVNDNFIL